MNQIGKLIVLLGIVIVVAGLIVWGLGRLGFRGLPGDIRFHSENMRLVFPIVTCLVISVVLTILANLAIWLWQYFNR